MKTARLIDHFTLPRIRFLVASMPGGPLVVDPKKHADDRNFVESILRYIPGFRGYLEKEYRRESDHLARTWLENRLQRSKRGLDDHMRRLTDQGALDALPRWERVRVRLDGLVSRIASAARGYSGVFDFVRVREDLLDQVYEHDMKMMRQTESLAAAIEQLAAREDASATELLRMLDALERRVQERGDLLNGLGDA